MSSVKYIEGPISLTRSTPKGVRRTAWGTYYPGQNMEGYGSKITTDYILTYKGRKYRVYATCFSNAASYWVTVKGEKTHLPPFDQSDIKG